MVIWLLDDKLFCGSVVVSELILKPEGGIYIAGSFEYKMTKSSVHAFQINTELCIMSAGTIRYSNLGLVIVLSKR